MTGVIIDLIRHGEPVGGRAYRGNGIDDPLSETGWQQMWSAVGEFAPWDNIITSPMSRCRDFAASLSGKHNIPLAVEKDVREIGFGVWEGKTPDELRHTEAYNMFYQDPANNRPDGAEDLAVFAARVKRAVDSIVDDFQGKHVLIVAHAGVIRAVLTTILQAPLASMYRIRSDYAGVTRIQYVETYYRILFHNNAQLLEL